MSTLFLYVKSSFDCYVYFGNPCPLAFPMQNWCQTYSLSPPTGNSQVRKVVVATMQSSRSHRVATSACIYKYQLATHLDRMIKQFSIFSVWQGGMEEGAVASSG